MLDVLIEIIIQTITTESPAFITTAMKIIIISMRRTIRQNMLNPIDTIVMMIRTMNAHRLLMTILSVVLQNEDRVRNVMPA